MRTVTFLPGYRKIEVERGTTILDAAQRAGLNMNVICGGQGKCGKCVVFIQSGKTEFDRQKYARFFTPAELDRGACLACETTVEGDIHVVIPEHTLIQEQKILIEGLDNKIVLLPSVKKYYVELQPPSLSDPSPDLSRLLWGIQKAGGPVAEKMYAPIEVLREIPGILRHSDWKVTGTIGLVPVIKLASATKAVRLGRALVKGGIPVAEVTFRTDAADPVVTVTAEALLPGAFSFKAS